ncbi:MAG: DUF445 family protein [Ruminiclostridium sp.]|nr:DUF445 family protein [Ruminiclostridium sp.]MBQ9933321.1 DUF445 family protein [Ruminiclostridium sp.]
MDLLHILLPIFLCALVGYCTNYIAIKMLFRPRKELRIGSWRVPFTPGVIPKNQPRIAAAVGKAVSGTLLTQEDMAARLTQAGLKEKLADSIQDAITEQSAPLSDLLPGDGEVTEEISQVVGGKILESLKKVDMNALVAEVAQTSFGDLFNSPMIAMFLGGGMLDNIILKLSAGVSNYLEEKGPELVVPMVREELDGMLDKPIRDNLDDLGIPEAALRNLLETMVGHVLENNLQAVVSTLDVKAVVEDKINAMDARELEDLVLSVMKNELQAIVNLGALIGAVIGIINIFI